MQHILITYDLCYPGQQYQQVYEAIKRFGLCVKITESAFLLKTNSSCVDIRNSLNACTDKNDKIFVCKLTGEAAWRNLITSDDSVKVMLT